MADVNKQFPGQYEENANPAASDWLFTARATDSKVMKVLISRIANFFQNYLVTIQRKINGKQLNADIYLAAGDVGATNAGYDTVYGVIAGSEITYTTASYISKNIMWSCADQYNYSIAFLEDCALETDNGLLGGFTGVVYMFIVNPGDLWRAMYIGYANGDETNQVSGHIILEYT